MKEQILYKIINNFINSLELNMDYIEKLSQKEQSETHKENIILYIKSGISLFKANNKDNIGKTIGTAGQRMLNKNLPFADIYGKALITVGTLIEKNKELSFKDIDLITSNITDALRNREEKSSDEALMFWEGFKNTINKGSEDKLTINSLIKKAIKENHWPMTRSDVVIEEHLMFFCLRLMMTIFLKDSDV